MEERRWAAQKAEQVKEKRRKDELDKQARLLEDKQKSEGAPELWDAFVGFTTQRVAAFNEALGEEALKVSSKPNELEVKSQFTRIHARFEPSRRISCLTPSTSMEYEISVIKGRAVLASRGHITITPDEAAEQFVDSLIQVL